MAYTCPDCLRMSAHPMDAQENFCGNCDEFKDRRFEPTPFQVDVIRASRARERAVAGTLLVMVTHLAGGDDPEVLLKALLELLMAPKAPDEQHEALLEAVLTLTKVTNWVCP